MNHSGRGGLMPTVWPAWTALHVRQGVFRASHHGWWSPVQPIVNDILLMSLSAKIILPWIRNKMEKGRGRYLVSCPFSYYYWNIKQGIRLEGNRTDLGYKMCIVHIVKAMKCLKSLIYLSVTYSVDFLLFVDCRARATLISHFAL